MTALALIGSGEYLEVCREVDEHLLSLLDVGDRPVRVCCLPTAAAGDGEAVWRGWSERGVAWFDGLGTIAVAADIIDRSGANDPSMVTRIADADLVYLSGGKPKLLHELLDGTDAWDAILTVLGRGGVLAGCSAGAMIQGSHIAGLRGGAESDGFGLIDGAVIIPHFDEFPSMITTAVRRVTARGRTVVGIDGGTALVRHRGVDQAVGRGGVEVWGPLGHRRFEREPIPDGFIAEMG